MDSTIITAIIGAIATITAAYITARLKDKTISDFKNQQRSSTNMLSPSEYGVQIVTPSDYDYVEKFFQVSGTYANLPDGHQLWVSTFGIATDSKGNKVKHYWPQEKATTENGKWYSKVYNIGGESGESKEFLVLAVGKDGQALIKYFKDASNESQKWTPIKKVTGDIVECAIGKVKLK